MWDQAFCRGRGLSVFGSVCFRDYQLQTCGPRVLKTWSYHLSFKEKDAFPSGDLQEFREKH